MDEYLQKLRRESSNDPEKQKALFVERVRSGELSRSKVEIASLLGHADSMKVLGVSPETVSTPTELLDRIQEIDPHVLPAFLFENAFLLQDEVTTEQSQQDYRDALEFLSQLIKKGRLDSDEMQQYEDIQDSLFLLPHNIIDREISQKEKDIMQSLFELFYAEKIRLTSDNPSEITPKVRENYDRFYRAAVYSGSDAIDVIDQNDIFQKYLEKTSPQIISRILSTNNEK